MAMISDPFPVLSSLNKKCFLVHVFHCAYGEISANKALSENDLGLTLIYPIIDLYTNHADDAICIRD